MAKSKQIVPKRATPQVPHTLASALLDFVGKVPASSLRKSKTPEADSRRVANTAAAQAALAAGALSLPPGPLGWLTIVPEIVTVWKIQAQMVADIAALYGKKASLTKEQMLYCLFRHTAAQAVRDLVVRVGERMLVRETSLRALQKIAERIGVRVSQRVLGKGITRWIPIVGAVGVGGYAYFDTAKIAGSARELFQFDIEVQPLTKQDAIEEEEDDA